MIILIPFQMKMHLIILMQNKPDPWIYIMGLTGFDRGFEVMEAIRGPEPRKKLELNINADEKLAFAA